MKRFIKLLLLFAILGGYFQSCSNMSDLETLNIPENDTPLTGTEYDRLMSDLAVAISHAAQNSAEFRNLVKTEVNKQFDGDYDLLLSQALPMHINPDNENSTRATASDFTVKDLIADYLPQSTTRSSGSTLDYLQQKFPKLQISVPVHAEDWDPATYTPVVCFIPSDFVDMKTASVKGIDAQGKTVDVDALNKPDKPVIVIGMNERSTTVGGWGGGGGLQPIQFFIAPQLSGTYSTGGAKLTWSTASLGQTTISGYKIYRSGPNNAANYTLISTVNSSVRSYTDYSVTTNSEYYYKVVAYGGFNVKVESDPIVIVANNTNLKPVLNLSAEAISDWRIELKWNNPTGENYKTQIERRSNSAPNYEVIATLNSTENTFVDDYLYLGERHTYLIRKIDTQGRKSDAVQTYAYATYRNPEARSDVYLKQIVCNLKDVESWLYGKPEFFLKVAGMGPDGKIVEFNTCDVKFASASGTSQIFTNVLLHKWSFFKNNNYYPALTFSLVEYDEPSATLSLNMGVKVGKKLADLIELSAGANLQVTFKNDGEKCGENSILYYENPEQWVYFPNYGARILLSEKP